MSTRKPNWKSIASTVLATSF